MGYVLLLVCVQYCMFECTVRVSHRCILIFLSLSLYIYIYIYIHFLFNFHLYLLLVHARLIDHVIGHDVHSTAPLKALPEFVYGSDVTLEMKLAYYLGPAYNTELLTYNGISRK